MKPILSVAVLFLSGFVLKGVEPKPDAVQAKATEKALETFAGTWEIVGAQPEGITKEARKLVFRKDATYAALDKDDKELWAGTFALDPTTTSNRPKNGSLLQELLQGGLSAKKEGPP